MLNRNRRYWPLSIKQAYYLMVTRGLAGRGLNDYAEFMALTYSSLERGLLPAKSIWQPVPEVRHGGAWENRDEFVRAEMGDLLWGYRRDLLQGQPRYVEVWLEKPELVDFFAGVTLDYCVSTVVCSDSVNLTFLDRLRRRLEDLPPGRTGVPGGRPEVVVLYFGDYIPTGPERLTELQEALRTTGNLWEVTLKRVALTRQQVSRKELPGRVRMHAGDEVLHPGSPGVESEVVELEALTPRSLVGLLRKAIEDELDMKLFDNQIQIQKREQTELNRLRADVLRQARHLLPEDS